MIQKNGGYMDTQRALYFKLNLDVIARKDTFQKISVTLQKSYDPQTP